MNKSRLHTFLIIACLSPMTHPIASADCIEELDARSKSGKVQLTWSAVEGAESYEVSRAEETMPSAFASIATVDAGTSTFLDFPAVNGLTYLYRVVADGCASPVVAVRPTLRRARGENSPPVIFTTAVESGAQGIQYRYPVGAADPDGDALEFLLSNPPGDMTIGPQSGLIEWLPPDAGIFPVEVVARDTAGNEDRQTFAIDVADTNLGGTIQRVGPAGGSVQDETGVEVIVPPGALAADALIGVRGLPDIQLLPGQLPSPLFPFLGGASLGPDGAQFDEAVTVTLPISQQLDEGTTLPVLVWDEDGNRWIEQEGLATVMPGGLSAQFTTAHFSVFTVFFNQIDSLPYFGPIDAFITPQDLLLRTRNRFFQLFNFGGSAVFDPGPSPLPGQQNLDFFNCYQVVGGSFVVDTIDQGAFTSFLGCESPEDCDADLAFSFARPFDEIFAVAGAQVQLVGEVGASIFLRSTSPRMEIDVDDDQLWVTEQSPVQARLLCGDQGFKEQEIDVLVTDGANLALTSPVTGTTAADGTFDTTLFANPTLGGLATVSGVYVWTSSLGDRVLDVVPLDEPGVDILSLTGLWFGEGTGTDFDCDDPEDDGTGPGSGSAPITQTGFSISGSVVGAGFGAAVTPTQDDGFTVNGTWQTAEAAGTWGGGGTVSGGVINVTFQGAGGGCRTRGGGTLTRVQ